MTLITYTAIFFFIALAAKQIGNFFSRLGLPYITGYLFAGMLASPFVLALLPKEATTELRYIDELSLAIIAFVAGSELYLTEIRSRLKSIAWVTGGVVMVALLLLGGALLILTQFISFTAGLPLASRIAVAILGSTVLLALSPASTIAVIKEVRAKGSFTQTVLGVTVSMDVIIIVFFAVAVAVASALINATGFDGLFVVALLVDLGAAVVVGLAVGKLLEAVLSSALGRWPKIGVVLLVGYAIFAAAYWVADYTHTSFPIEIHAEPLLAAMIAGFYITNYTRHREEFADLLHDIGPAIYVAFFTLTGVAIKLDILWATLPIAIALFLTRVLAIGIGSFVGGRAAGETPQMQRYAWMGLITQAGIALGLAREAAVEFPSLGDSFATMIISVVVLNEIFGPMFLKAALKRAGEVHLPQAAVADEQRDVVIFGIEPQSLALVQQLQRHNWQVTLVDTDAEQVQELNGTAVARHHLPQLGAADLRTLITPSTDAVVTMLANDEHNQQVCEAAYEQGVGRIVVRLNGMNHAERFAEFGALIMDQTSAMVALLEQAVRATRSAALLLHQDTGREFVQITISNQDVDGRLVRDLRLPSDVLLLHVMRHGQAIAPNGYTQLRLKDEVTLLGKPESLEEVTLKLGY